MSATEERGAFRVLAATSKGNTLVSLVDVLFHLSVPQTAGLHVSLQLASEAVLTGDIIPAVEALGDVLTLLGFTLVQDGRSFTHTSDGQEVPPLPGGG